MCGRKLELKYYKNVKFYITACSDSYQIKGSRTLKCFAKWEQASICLHISQVSQKSLNKLTEQKQQQAGSFIRSLNWYHWILTVCLLSTGDNAADKSDNYLFSKSYILVGETKSTDKPTESFQTRVNARKKIKQNNERGWLRGERQWSRKASWKMRHLTRRSQLCRYRRQLQALETEVQRSRGKRGCTFETEETMGGTGEQSSGWWEW